MKTHIRLSFLIALIVNLVATTGILAAPPPPAGYYGTVKQNGTNVSDGTSVTVWCNGVQSGQITTQSWEGNSVYSVDVIGDDPDTTGTVEGCRENDVVSFQVGGRPATPDSLWHSGSNSELNLVAAPLVEPQLDNIQPSSAVQGSVLTLTVTAIVAHFQPGVTQVSLGSGIQVANVVVADATHLSARLTIDNAAAVGPRTLYVTTGAEVLTRTAAFTVSPAAAGIPVYLPAEFSAPMGSQVSIPISTPVDLNGLGIYSIHWVIKSNPNVLRGIGVDKTGTLSAQCSIEENHNTPGQLIANATCLTPLSDPDSNRHR